MIAFLILLVRVLVSPFKTQARLEAEIVLLRHQLNVLRQRVPSKPRLTVADRLLFDGLSTVLALEVALSGSRTLPTRCERWCRSRVCRSLTSCNLQ